MFSAVKLTENGDIDNCKYSGYSVIFDRRGNYSFPSGGLGGNVIIFEVDMSSSVHVDNKKEDISILGEGPTQGLNGTTLTAEKRYSVNFTLTKKICVSVHFNGENLIYLLMIQKLLNLRRKILKL